MNSRLPWRQCAYHGVGWHARLPGRGLGLCGSLVPLRRAHGDAVEPSNPLLNPPTSTRPPPLTVPQRSSVSSTIKYVYQMGKGYLKFYKDGTKAVFANRKLLRRKLEQTPREDLPTIFRPYYVPSSFSRADWVLLWRVRHDMLRLPLFGLMLLLIGEFTALVVIYVDGVVPYTCRIPRQMLSAAQRAEQRRRAAFEELEERSPHGVLSPRVTADMARKHVLRSLDLAGSIWDRLGFMPPGLWQVKGRLRMAFLEGDDKKLIQYGGPLQLESAEVAIACRERGIDTLGKSKEELRGLLSDWLRLTAAADISERRRRMATLLLTRCEHWPAQRDFAVPEWEL